MWYANSSIKQQILSGLTWWKFILLSHISLLYMCCGGFVTKSCLTLLWPHGPCQAPLSMGFPRQELWNGLPFPFPRDLPDPGIKTWVSCIVGGFYTDWATREVLHLMDKGRSNSAEKGSDPVANIYPTRHFIFAHFSISVLWWPLRGLSGDTLSHPVIGDSAQTASCP